MKKTMIASDYIVEYLISKGIDHVFGFPGGMVTYLMDSFEKYKNQISAHVNYHEQAASFCACSFGQINRIPGVAYATSGPGATNLITGIANAYYDSIPTIFITGQVKTTELMDGLQVRQKGFQEMDVATLASSITKYSERVMSANDLRYHLEKAYYLAMEGRPGPVLIDIPMDVQRTLIEPERLEGYVPEKELEADIEVMVSKLAQLLSKSKRPVIIGGNGINIGNARKQFRLFADALGIPVVTSMISVDLYPSDNYLGFIGAYGHRAANFAVANADLLIAIGTRLDCRQTGENKESFCPNADVFRIDIDSGEMSNQIKKTEFAFRVEAKNFLDKTIADEKILKIAAENRYDSWLSWCLETKSKLKEIDRQEPNEIVKYLSSKIPDNMVITTDVGQNQVWVAQAFKVKEGQRVLFSGGHAAMGYSVPAGIGAFYATGSPVVCFTGDGGIQMNIQELKFIEREKLPIKIILLNNHSLGMIRHFQEMYFNSIYTQTKEGQGYETPNFEKIANAYGIKYKGIRGIKGLDEIGSEVFTDLNSWIIEVLLEKDTYVYPKLAINKAFYDQEPPLDEEMMRSLLNREEK